ncbi:MAG: hypothetical protein ACKVVT_07720 [Dehalococcoidia bacterium]
MSSRRRDRKPKPAAAPPAGNTIPAIAQRAPERRPLPQWQWRTFPVFFMFALGLFLGVFVGVPSGIASEAGDTQLPQLVAFLVAAILLGLALSHLVVRWLLSRGFVRQRPRGK